MPKREAAYWGISGAERHYCTFECSRKRLGVRSPGGVPRGGELGARGDGPGGRGARTLRGGRVPVGRRPGTGGKASAECVGSRTTMVARAAWRDGAAAKGTSEGVSGPRGSTARPSETERVSTYWPTNSGLDIRIIARTQPIALRMKKSCRPLRGPRTPTLEVGLDDIGEEHRVGPPASPPPAQ